MIPLEAGRARYRRAVAGALFRQTWERGARRALNTAWLTAAPADRALVGAVVEGHTPRIALYSHPSARWLYSLYRFERDAWAARCAAEADLEYAEAGLRLLLRAALEGGH